MKNLKNSMLLLACACSLALFACSDDSSSGASNIDEKFESSSSVIQGSSAQENVPVSSAIAVPVTADKDWRDSCLDIINEYRATEDLEPLARATDEKLTCTDRQAADDLASGKSHGHFGDCGEGAQNTGPNVTMSGKRSYVDYAQMYLKMMWEDEKALVTSGKADPDNGDDYGKIGHYLNMKGKYKTVACGFAVSSDGSSGWLNIDFFR